MIDPVTRQDDIDKSLLTLAFYIQYYYVRSGNDKTSPNEIKAGFKDMYNLTFKTAQRIVFKLF